MRKRILVTLLSSGALFALASAASAQVISPCCVDEMIATAPAESITLASNMAETMPPGNDEATPVAPPPEPEGVEISTFLNVESNRIFQDQGLDLDTGAVVVGDITISHPSGFYADFWFAANGNRHAWERDYTLGYRTGIWDFHIAIDEVPDSEEILDLKASVSIPLNTNLTFNGYVQIARGGFTDNVVHAEVAFSHDLGNGWNIDGNVGPSYTTSERAFTLGYEVGVSRQIGEVSIRAFAKAYASGHGSATIVGVGVSRSFN